MSDEPEKRAELATAIRIWLFLAATIGVLALVIWIEWDGANSGFWRGVARLLWAVLSHLK